HASGFWMPTKTAANLHGWKFPSRKRPACKSDAPSNSCDTTSRRALMSRLDLTLSAEPQTLNPPHHSMSRVVQITAPSRLHFGLWSLGGGPGRQFGGVGAMIDQPQLQLVIEPAEQLEASGDSAERVIGFACRWAAFHG